MDIRFLGTGAADWCRDDKNRTDYRRLSSLLIDNELLIDPGPEIFDFEADFNFNGIYNDIENILVTHSHDDHFCPKNVGKLCAVRPRNIFLEKHVAEQLNSLENIKINTIKAFSTFKVGNYTVTPVPGNHTTDIPEEQPFHYIIEKGDKRIFYGLDGAWYRAESWEYLEQFTFDAVILDGTLGYTHGDNRIFVHNNLYMIEMLADLFKSRNMLKSNAKIMLTHMSRDTQLSPDELSEKLSPLGITAAYDGLKVNI